MSEDQFKRFREISSVFGEDGIVEAEEAARELAQKVAERIPEPEKMATNIIDEDNYTVKGIKVLIDSDTRGKLREFTLKSPSTDFRITIMRDGKRILDRSFQELMSISAQSDFLDAFQDTEGYYILRVSEISWLNDFLLTLNTAEKVTFNHIFAEYEEAYRYR